MKKEKGIPCNGNEKKAGTATLILNKMDFRTKIETSNKEEQQVMIIFRQDDNYNIHAHNTGAPKYINDILTNIKKETNSNRIVVVIFTTTVTSMDQSS